MSPGPGRPLLLALFEVAAGRTFAPSLPIPASEVEWAIRAGMGPLLHAESERQPGLLPGPLAARVRAADRLARLESAERLEAASEILDRCGERAGPVTLLKGISIATEHHRQPHHRAMGDIDLLVEAEGVAALESALGELGYRPARWVCRPWTTPDITTDLRWSMRERACAWRSTPRCSRRTPDGSSGRRSPRARSAPSCGRADSRAGPSAG